MPFGQKLLNLISETDTGHKNVAECVALTINLSSPLIFLWRDELYEMLR